MAARLPYAIAAKQVPLCGLLRFELSRPLRFSGINESTWDSIYRRSPAITLRAKFAPESELCGKPGVFPKDDTLKEFLDSRPAAAVFLHLLIEHMNMYTVAESTEMIDSCARIPDGPTWKTMREARNLKQEVQQADGAGETGCQFGDEGRRLREISDALAVLSIEQNADVQDTPASINSLWKLLAYPHAAEAPQG